MALDAIIDAIDTLPEPVRKEYTKRDDGKYQLQVNAVDGFALENVTGLKSALTSERDNVEQLKKTVGKFKDIDPDKAREALAKLDEFNNFDPKKDAERIANEKFENAKKQLVEKHQQELKAQEDRAAKLTKKVETLLIDSVATSAIAENKGSVNLLLPHVQRMARVKENSETGDFMVEIVGADGKVRIGNNNGDPMDIKGLITEMKQSSDYARAFDSEGKGGGGTPPNRQGSGGRQDISHLSPVERMNAARASGAGR